MTSLMAITDLSGADGKVATFVAVHAEHVGHHARAIKTLQQTLENKPGSLEVENRYGMTF